MGKENTPFRGHSGRIDVSVPNALAARAHESLPGRRLGPLPPWLRYVVGGSAAALVYLVIPSSIPLPALVPRLLLYQGVSASAVVALVVGVRRHRPSNPTPWYLLIAGQAIYLVADLTFSTLHDLLHSTAVAATEQPLLTRSAAAAYPIMDMLVLAVAARLSVGAGLRRQSFYLLVSSLGVLLATDPGYIYLQLMGLYQTDSLVGRLLDAGWLSFYLLLGAAALHPSMRTLSERDLRSHSRLTRGRLVFLASAALLTPAAIIVQAFRGDQHDTAVLAVACTLLFLLVIYRMSGLIRQ